MPFTIPVAVALLQCIGVGGGGCPSSCKLSVIVLDYFAFRDSARVLHLLPMLRRSIWNRVNIVPFMCMGCLSCGFHPRNKCPAAWILASLADK